MLQFEEIESIFDGSFQELSMFQNRDSEGIRTRSDAIFHLIRTINNQLEKACSATDKATRNQLVIACLAEIQIALNSEPTENQSIYIPSEQRSVRTISFNNSKKFPFFLFQRVLELAQDAGQKCMSKFNVTLSSIIRDVKSKNKNKQNICTVYCIYSELEIVSYKYVYRPFLFLNTCCLRLMKTASTKFGSTIIEKSTRLKKS